MKENFQYKGYSAELTWSVTADTLRAAVKITATPRVGHEKHCFCSGFGYHSDTGVGSEKLNQADREVAARRLAIGTKNRLKQDIDDHLKRGSS